MDKRKFIQLFTMGTALTWAQLALGTAPLGDMFADPEADDFLQACSTGQLEQVKTLLTKNPQLLQAKDSIGRSGFALALLAGHRHVGSFLQGAGYQTDLHEAALDLDWDRFEELLGKESDETRKRVNADHPVGGTTMWAASAGGAGPQIWRIYAQCGDPNLNPKGKAGSSPLQIALKFPDLSVAELTAASLLSNNTNPNPAPNAEMPPLHLAAKRGSYAITEMLIRLGAEVDQATSGGTKAIQLAEQHGHEQVYHLLKNHQNIARTCHTSRMAFHRDGSLYQAPVLSDIPLYVRNNLVGNSHRNLDEVKKAIAADVRLAHSIATTSEICVEAGAHMGNREMVDFLLENGAPYSLPTAVMMGDYATAKRLLDQDPNRIHERGAHDFALLWYPVIGDCPPEMMQLLLDRGAKVEEQHFLGTTALHWACMRENRIDLVEMLVENGADLNRVGRKFGGKAETPLQMAASDAIARYLRSKGAK